MTRDEQWEQLRSLVAFLESNTTPHIHRRDAVAEARRTMGPAIDALQSNEKPKAGMVPA